MTEHEKLVERVAMKIEAADNSPCPDGALVHSDCSDWGEHLARAAIAECYRALMEPNNFMVAATIGHRMSTSIGGQNDWYADGEKLIKAAIAVSPLNANTENKP